MSSCMFSILLKPKIFSFVWNLLETVTISRTVLNAGQIVERRSSSLYVLMSFGEKYVNACFTRVTSSTGQIYFVKQKFGSGTKFSR